MSSPIGYFLGLKAVFDAPFGLLLKGIFSDSSNLFFGHEFVDINKKISTFPKFQLIAVLRGHNWMLLAHRP